VEFVRAQLFPDVPAARFLAFECGHVVPPEAFLTLAVASGPGGRHRLTTEYADRNSDAATDALLGTVAALAEAIPAGVVCFLPSFAYLERFVARAQATAAWARLQAAKKVSPSRMTDQGATAGLAADAHARA
jgi:chromosome transmission fidelity protein 1